MAPRRLSSAAKRQSGQTAKKAASKLASGSGKTSTPTAPSAPITHAAIVSAALADIKVPGLVGIAPESIAGQMPKFEPEKYAVSDPLNPPDTIPQATVEQHRRGMAIYEGGMRALDLTGAAFDFTGKKFTVLGKQAKAFGAGLQAATEFEKDRGYYLDYLNQLESNEQKNIAYGVNQAKTISDRTSSTYKKEEINQKEEQARLASEKAKLDTQKKQAEFDGIKTSLGTLPSAS